MTFVCDVGGVGDWKLTSTQHPPNLPQHPAHMHLGNQCTHQIVCSCVLFFHLTPSSLRTWILSDLSLYPPTLNAISSMYGAQYLFIFKILSR